PTRLRHTGPAEDVADVAGDAERRIVLERYEAPIRPRRGPRAARRPELRRDPELLAERNGPRLACQEGVGARRKDHPAHLDAPQLASRARSRLHAAHLERGVGLPEPVRRGETTHPAADDDHAGRPGAHVVIPASTA